MHADAFMDDFQSVIIISELFLMANKVKKSTDFFVL